MKMIDLHCDTAMKILLEEKVGILEKNDFHVDINKLKKSNSMIQFFAYFVHLEWFNKNGFEFKNEMEVVKAMHDRFMKEVEATELNLILKPSDIKKDQLGALLTLEGGGCIESLEDIDTLYDMGVRLITITWNWINKMGHPNVPEENMGKGLTTFGIEAVKKMNELGIIVDVSHLSDAGFWDVLKHSTKPVVASHSNARSIAPHVRNLTDEMIKEISSKNGVIGLNFCSAFLTEDVQAKVMKIKDLVANIKHIVKIGGIDCMALGTDFDGIGGTLEIKDIGDMHLLKEALLDDGFTEEDVEKIWYKNALRLIEEVL